MNSLLQKKTIDAKWPQDISRNNDDTYLDNSLLQKPIDAKWKQDISRNNDGAYLLIVCIHAGSLKELIVTILETS